MCEWVNDPGVSGFFPALAVACAEGKDGMAGEAVVKGVCRGGDAGQAEWAGFGVKRYPPTFWEIFPRGLAEKKETPRRSVIAR